MYQASQESANRLAKVMRQVAFGLTRHADLLEGLRLPEEGEIPSSFDDTIAMIEVVSHAVAEWCNGGLKRGPQPVQHLTAQGFREAFDNHDLAVSQPDAYGIVRVTALVQFDDAEQLDTAVRIDHTQGWGQMLDETVSTALGLRECDDAQVALVVGGPKDVAIVRFHCSQEAVEPVLEEGNV